MSKLQELINTLCPDGVEYKTIKEIATDIYRGAGIKRDEVTEDGIPCVRYGEIYTTYGIFFDECVSHTHCGEQKKANMMDYLTQYIELHCEKPLYIDLLKTVKHKNLHMFMCLFILRPVFFRKFFRITILSCFMIHIVPLTILIVVLSSKSSNNHS
jgi:hypothetical protein